MDLYYVRSSIKKALDCNLHNFRGTLLDVGCGEMAYREYLLAHSDISKYIGLDIENKNYQKKKLPDIIWNGKKIGLSDNSVDCAMATEVLEHVPRIENVLKEICRVLRPGGRFFFTVPYLWPLHDAPYDEYRYTPFSLKRHLDTSDFTNINIKALGGWNASLAQMIGLWINRSGLPQQDKQRYAQKLLPFYKALIESDTTDFEFTSQTMYTGLYGIASKKNAMVGSPETNNKLIEIKTSNKDRQSSTKPYKKKK
jgi:ubiquinone/menaquinone biosynthesis C-methylase UbiE